MSGRSAYVRKEKTEEKSKKKTGAVGGTGAGVGSSHSEQNSLHGSPSISLLGDFPAPEGRTIHFAQNTSYQKNQSELTTVKSGSSASDDLAYARVKNPPPPVILDSGIEKSTFRSLMDKRSDGVRKGLIKTFGLKKKQVVEEARPQTSATIRADNQDLDAGDYFIPPPESMLGKSRNQTYNQLPYQQNQIPDYTRPGPPSSKLPPIPQGPQLKRWLGGGIRPQPWNKLRKDPELWDPNGDTLVYFSHDMSPTNKPPPSFRLSSYMIEQTESRFLITLLREGSTEDSNNFNMPPSPISSPGLRPVYPTGASRNLVTPPMSDASMGYDGQISYEIYFPPPQGLSKTDVLRHQISTRNVFALIYSASLVGINFFQTLQDLQERIEQYLAPHVDPVQMIIDYLAEKGIDDIRENPTVAAGMLAWSETPTVRWEEGWREAYVHCAGMHTRLETTADYRFITPITKALLERASLEVQVRVQNCEDRLSGFDFEDMWPLMSSQPPPARTSFERIRKFFAQYYLDAYSVWPPAAPAGEEQWLTRSLVQKMQKDFGALYDYLVNREVNWDCSEERSGRKWNIVHEANRSFDADTFDLPFTDLLVAFDNRHKYPHIPHPYPLVPESIPVKNSKENLFKTSKKKDTPKAEDKMAERRAALAYTESTNIYLLGSDFVSNEFVEAFVRFEKADKASEVDPFAARRGRWILIYGVLQTLASITVDTPNLRHSGDVSYHLNPRLRGTPPWKGASQNVEEATHVGSYCWTIRDTWGGDSPTRTSPGSDKPMSRGAPSFMTSTAPSIMSDSDTGYSRPSFNLRSDLPTRRGPPSLTTSTAPSIMSDSDAGVSRPSYNVRLDIPMNRGPPSIMTTSTAPSVISDSDAGSLRPTFSPISSRSRGTRNHRLNDNSEPNGNRHGAPFGSGSIEKMGEWPIRLGNKSRTPEQSREPESRVPSRNGRRLQRDFSTKDGLHKDFMKLSHSENDLDQKQLSKDFTIKDFDKYEF
jgi:hypothetical protein